MLELTEPEGILIFDAMVAPFIIRIYMGSATGFYNADAPGYRKRNT